MKRNSARIVALSGVVFALGLASCVTVTIDRPKKRSAPQPVAQPEAGIFEGGPAPAEGQPMQPAPPPLDETKKLYKHTIVAGDSLWKLSREWNTTVSDIQAANGMTDDVIRAGDSILIPTHNPPEGAVEVQAPAPAPAPAPILTPAPTPN